MLSKLHPFRRVPLKELHDEQLYEAERNLLEHQASAEYYAGMAAIYRARVARLREQGPTPAEQLFKDLV